MQLNKSKYIVDTINGIRCRIVETGIDKERVDFLHDLLKLNGYKVMFDKNEEGKFRLGVTDLMFNPVIAIYERSLKSKTGNKVTPAYWLQISENETEKEVNYWTNNHTV